MACLAIFNPLQETYLHRKQQDLAATLTEIEVFCLMPLPTELQELTHAMRRLKILLATAEHRATWVELAAAEMAQAEKKAMRTSGKLQVAR